MLKIESVASLSVGVANHGIIAHVCPAHFTATQSLAPSLETDLLKCLVMDKMVWYA